MGRRETTETRGEATRTSGHAAGGGLSHRDDIQGLRALAVLLVALAHAGVGFLAGGFVGVDVFFVLSGFLITSLLLAEARARGSVSLLEFYLRRARRILPAAALTLLVTDVAAFFLLNFMRARAAVHDSLGAAAFAANLRFASRGVDYFAQAQPPSPVLHYWSLSVEEQFYLVWPLLLSLALFGIAVKRHGRVHHERRLLLVVVGLTAGSLAWSVRATATLPAAAYYSPFARAWELGLGATLAVAASMLPAASPAVRAALGWAGLAMVVSAAVVFSGHTPFPGSAALLPTGGTALAITAGLGGTSARLAPARLLGLRPLRFVGDRSYTFYLWHWPVLILAAAYAGHALPLGTKLLLLAGAFALSCVTYALVENPIRRGFRGRTSTGVVAFASVTAVLCTASVALAGINREQHQFEGTTVAHGATLRILSSSSAPGGVLPVVAAAVRAAQNGAPLPKPLTPPIDQLAAYSPAYDPPSECIAHDASTRTGEKVCRLGDASSGRLIVLMGDSHALMWAPALLRMASQDHWAVVPLLRLGCTPENWVGRAGVPACRAWYHWALAEAARLHPQVTLVGGAVSEHGAAAAAGVLAAGRALAPHGRVVLIGDPESLDANPVDCLLSKRASMATCTTTWPSTALAPYDEVEHGAPTVGAGFLQTRGFVCYEARCPAVVGHTIVWADSNHMSVTYSAVLVSAFRSAFQRAFAQARR